MSNNNVHYSVRGEGSVNGVVRISHRNTWAHCTQIKNNRHDKHKGIILHSKKGPDHPPTSYSFTQQALAERLYPLCSPEDLAVAVEKVRPGPMSYQVVGGRLHHSADRYGTVPRVFIMCEKDLVIRVASAERMVKLNPPKEVICLRDADHMPFVSATKLLHHHLTDIAHRYGSTSHSGQI